MARRTYRRTPYRPYSAERHKRLSQRERWAVYILDVWTDPDGTHVVNDMHKVGTINVPKEASVATIKSAIKRQVRSWGFGMLKVSAEWVDRNILAFNRSSDGYPVVELRLED